jgi:hypothetical protein
MAGFPEMKYPPRVIYEAPASTDDLTSLKYLQLVYQGRIIAEGDRMRVAIAALPFENPKLAVTASVGPNSGLGRRIELAIARSRHVIEHRPTVADVEAD